MKRTALFFGLGWILLATTPSSVASAGTTVWVRVPNVSQLFYQTAGNFVYIRNMNQFDPNALGCCYNYWIDTSTQEGKNIFGLMLTAAAQGQGLWFGLPSGYASGALAYAGNW